MRKARLKPKGISRIVTLVDNSRVDLEKIVADIASKAGMKKCPRIVLDDGVEAHTRFKKICIGRDLPSHLTKDEMKGVIAHECYHISRAKLFDTEIFFSALFVVVACAYLYVFGVTAERPEVLLMVVLFVPYSLLIHRYMSMRAEFEADAFAKSIVGVKPFSVALEKYDRLRKNRSIVSKLVGRVLLPHPALKDRLRKVALAEETKTQKS